MPTETKFLGVYGAVWLAVLALTATVLFARRMWQLLRILLLGRRENRLDHIGLRLATLVREVLFQSRMLRGESIINWAHPAIFWGFCMFVLASALLFLGGIAAPWIRIPQAEEIPVLGTVVDLFAVIVLVGLIASSIRRYILRPPGLQRTADATIVVSLIAALMVTYLMAEAGSHVKQSMAPEAGHWGQTWLPFGAQVAHALTALGVPQETIVHIGVGAWWVHAMILLFFLVYLPYSKHMHLLWAPAAVFFAEMPHKGMLLPGEEKEAANGDKPANPLAGFTWRMLLNGYACAECGRCERVCPVAASGAKLSPRQVVHDLKEFVLTKGLATVQGRLGNGNGRVFVGGTIEPAAIWGCATCHACVDKCPVRNEHVALIVEMRRRLVEQGQLDSTLQETLLSLQRYGNSQTKSPKKRFDWAKDLPVPLKDARKEPVETLWFLGDYAAFHPSSMRVSRSIALVFQAAGLNFGVLGDGEQSAGNDVRRLGEEGLFEMLAEKNMKTIAKADFQRIVTTDPHTYHALRHEYGRFGLDKPVQHYTEVLDDLLGSGKLALKQRLSGCAVYHDPCYLGRYNGIYDPPRRIIDALGLRRSEMPRNREDSFCCGAGGGKIWMQEEEGVSQRPAILRINEALQVPGVTHFVVACPKDLGMFQDAVKTVGAEGRLRVADLGELVCEAMQGDEEKT
ncbi:MAG: (Fe-S)-binding protein [Thermoguttaceae bacterium]